MAFPILERLIARFSAPPPILSAPVVDGPDLLRDLALHEPPVRVVEGEVVDNVDDRAMAVGTMAAQVSESLMLPGGALAEPDDHLYRRVSGGHRQPLRNLSPLKQDQALQVSWYLWEQNPLARRLIVLMTDLILGDGFAVESDDPVIQEQIDLTWNHARNQIRANQRKFYFSLALNGELAITAARNPITGRPIFGMVDALQVSDVIMAPDNVLVPEWLVLKPERPGAEPRKLQIVHENPATGRLEGEVFFTTINNLPNSGRGRPDLLPLADWLDLYDQYLFAEVERISHLSRFVWDVEIKGAPKKDLEERARAFGTPKPGSAFFHNENEKLNAVTPSLNAQDRSEVARMLRTHIAGSMGFPTSYVGDVDSNRATIEGQNDVLMKTPAARQKEFASFVDLLVRYTLEGVTTTNPALFRNVNPSYRIRMPEIAAKDVSRVGTIVASVVAAMDTAMANRTMSRKAAAQVQVALIEHLGVHLDPAEVLEQADEDADEAADRQDEFQAALARQRGQRSNPPIPGDVPDDDVGDRGAHGH